MSSGPSMRLSVSCRLAELLFMLHSPCSTVYEIHQWIYQSVPYRSCICCTVQRILEETCISSLLRIEQHVLQKHLITGALCYCSISLCPQWTLSDGRDVPCPARLEAIACTAALLVDLISLCVRTSLAPPIPSLDSLSYSSYRYNSDYL